MLEVPVKLIVKAPNQQFEDQTIHCNLSWTIKRLKGYLSEVYPSKPNTEDQRLIYYGQLLNDSVTLKDVFTRYEAGEETHTVHLVCMPSKENLKMQARKITEETNWKEREGSSAPSGSRTNDRISTEESENVTEQDADNSRSAERNYFPSSGQYQYWLNNVYPQPPENYNYLQHLAWMQRVCSNYYMSLYMDMIARQNGGAYREGYVDPRQTEAVHNPEPQPRREEENNDNRVNRDWLDYLYAISRFLILFSIFYYSSPARFFIVVVPGILMYLYRIDFFRINQVQGLDNVNEIGNNNGAEPAPAPGDNNNGAQEDADEPAEEEVGPQTNTEQGQEIQERPTFMALTWTFVTSFFSSMIPELQNQI